MTAPPVKSDPEIAAAIFESDLTGAMRTTRAQREGWKLTKVGPLVAVVEMFGGLDSERKCYYVKLEADWYNQYPPKATFVVPEVGEGWPDAQAGSRWLPRLDNIHPGFALHAAYGFPDGASRQLICSSINLQYYWTHEPEASKSWVPGSTTLMWTLAVIQDELSGAGYRGSSDAPHS